MSSSTYLETQHIVRAFRALQPAPLTEREMGAAQATVETIASVVRHLDAHQLSRYVAQLRAGQLPDGHVGRDLALAEALWSFTVEAHEAVRS